MAAGMQEHTFVKPGVGTLRVVGDPEDEPAFKVKHIAFAEFEGLSGGIWPLTALQAVYIMRYARTERQAVMIAEAQVASDQGE